VRRIPQPTFPLDSVLQAVTRVVEDADVVLRFWNSVPQIREAELNYMSHALADRLYLIPASSGVGYMTKAEMSKIYKGNFARKGSYLRSNFYDVIMAAAPFGICPSCNQRTVSNLDHYLPQVDHSALAITPINLVPICSECNKTKLSYSSSSAEEQLLHPYFDNVEDEVWLFAKVVEGEFPSLEFLVNPPEHWSKEKRARIDKHFKVLKLGHLFVSHGARLISDIGSQMSRLWVDGGPGAVATHLKEQAATRRTPARLPVVRNSWQIAAYQALGDSDYFCNFNHLA
jgi:hypothetical protein